MTPTDSSLKEYYIRLVTMYNNALSMLAAINQSLSSNANEITVTVADTDDATSTIRIPSFLYLENRIEEIGNTLDSILNLPDSGEAWLSKTDENYKIELIRSNTAPATPNVSVSADYVASMTDNNIFKDLVSPKMFLKLNISNLPRNAESMYMRKLVIYSESLYKVLSTSGASTYAEYAAILYNYKKGSDYDVYDAPVDLPMRHALYQSAFSVSSVSDGSNGKYTFSLGDSSDTAAFEYYDEDDLSTVKTLAVGDTLCKSGSSAVYEVTAIDYDNHTVSVKTSAGRGAIADNDTLYIYSENFDGAYDYVQVPLEENRYICVFLATVCNGVRSEFADGILLDLSTISIVDAYGNAVKDRDGKNYVYTAYYRDYCTNLGDLIIGMSQCAYPQISNYTESQLAELVGAQDEEDKTRATITQSVQNALKVVAINKHLTDDLTAEDIINLHNQKNDINAKLQTCQSNIDEVYSTLLSTDFSQNVTVTQQSLQNKIQEYYTERTDLQKQLNAIVDNINSKAGTLNIDDARTKYRVRGVTDVTDIEKWLAKSEYYSEVDLIGLDVEYKYKTTNKDTTTLTNINGSTFSEWNKQTNIEKERKLVFNDNGMHIEFVNYASTDNIIKWNQIDIPIKEGEDVVVRVRYKYSIGQPFMDIYSPWSDEIVVVFPTEFTDNQEINSVIESNNVDTITSTFSKILINDGYTEHIQNKVLSNEQVFFHMPENIYSGFNTAENNLISLKDKLTALTNDVEKYKAYIDGLANTAFDVYLSYDDNQVLLSPNSMNKINVYNTDHITDMYIRKEMNIVIKNTGSTKLDLYSIFPGNVDTHLITDSSDYFASRKPNYERVPMIVNGERDGQYLGQWIYFRQNNPFTYEDVYLNTVIQNAYDYLAARNDTDGASYSQPVFKATPSAYMKYDNKQVLLPFRDNKTIDNCNYSSLSPTATDEQINAFATAATDARPEAYSDFSFFKYGNDEKLNEYIMKFSDIIGTRTGSTSTYALDPETSLTSFMTKYNVSGFTAGKTSSLQGAFLYPNLLSKTQILTDGSEQGSKTVSVGSSLSIPVVFEYYVEAPEDGASTSITKSIYFDIRNSLISEPLHYMVQVTGNYDYTTSGDIYKNIDTIILS